MDILTLVLTPLTLVVVLLAIGKYRYENGYSKYSPYNKSKQKD
ncbi:hypothetical protein [Sulfurimonas sp. SWIR-19]|nr:hypothetical protein [Sulfurimonas sp. SWIR-19]